MKLIRKVIRLKVLLGRSRRGFWSISFIDTCLNLCCILVPDETKARSRWWVSSRAYFDGRSFEDEQIPRHLNQNNYFEDPSEMYREFEEQRRGYQQMKEKNDDMYEKMTRFMEDMRRVPEANTTPIIADQHFGVSDISGFQSYQPGTSNWQNPMTSHRQDAEILDPNLCDRARRELQPSVYILIPYTVLPSTTVLTKKGLIKQRKWARLKIITSESWQHFCG
nr:hypothetical protein [Tanacetum cinerariifolium]